MLAVVSYRWECNRRFGVVLVMRHSGLSSLGASGRVHPPTISVGFCHLLPFTAVQLIQPGQYLEDLSSKVVSDRSKSVGSVRPHFDRSFAVAGPRVWNSLPATIRQITGYGQFRQHLKTFIQGLEIAAHCDSFN